MAGRVCGLGIETNWACWIEQASSQLRFLVLSDAPERWSTFEVEGHEVTAVAAIRLGEDILVPSDVSVIDHDIFVISIVDPARGREAVGRNRIQVLAAITERAEAGGRIITFADAGTANVKLPGLPALRALSAPSEVVRFQEDSPLAAALQRFASEIRCTHDFDGGGFARSNSGRGVATLTESCLVLPAVTSRPELVRRMVSTLSDWLPAIGTAAEPEPDWATEITWTRSDELVSRLAEAEAELVAVTEARDVVERDLATERQWATLLWETGVDALESIVAAALAELGLNVERPSETEREDLRRADSDVVLIIEVTGSRRMIDLAKPGSTEPATRFGCRDTQTGAPLKLG